MRPGKIKSWWPALLLSLVAALSIAAACGGDDAAEGEPKPSPTTAATRTPRPTSTAVGEEARVVRVVDGDTIEIESGERVRYIGIDTPEATAEQECFGREATERNEELVLDETVRLEKDVSETDRFGRLLRYVWMGDRLINEVLVREGYAAVSTFPPDVKYQKRFVAAEREARDANAGLWGACGGPDTSVEPTQPPPPPPGANCDPSYPTVCIPPAPPDLDCPEVGFTNFPVLPPDPQGFDGDGDGVGCET